MQRVSLVNQHMTHQSHVSRFFLHLTTTVISINGESESGPQTINANTLFEQQLQIYNNVLQQFFQVL